MFGALQLGLGLTRGQGGFEWYPNRLFQSGDILLWYDPSDLTTMFQDTTGVTPVTADGQSVAIVLDKGQWGGKTLEQVLADQTDKVVGARPFTGIPAQVTSASGGTLAMNGNAVRLTIPSDTNSVRMEVDFTGVVGRYYKIVVQGATNFGLTMAAWANLSLATPGSTASTSPNIQYIVRATGTACKLRFYPRTSSGAAAAQKAGDYVEFSEISIRELPGYHREQATGTSMPKYKTGPNPAAAENSPDLKGIGVIDITGIATAATYNTTTGEGSVSRVDLSNQSFVTFSPLDDTIYHAIDVTCLTGTILVRVGTFSGTGLYTLPAGASILVPMALTNRISITHTTAVGTSTFVVNSLKEIPASAPYIHWLLYDGTDDSHSTSGINWGTDEVAACVGLYKASDAAQACFAAFGTNGGTAGVSAEQGLILAPGAAAATTYYARFVGSLTPTQAVATGYAAPHTGVVSVRGKIATDVQGISVNQGTEAFGSGDMGTGNFGSAIPVHFGRRAGSSLPFNGREYQTVIRSRLLSAAELSSLETFVAEKTGVIL